LADPPPILLLLRAANTHLLADGGAKTGPTRTVVVADLRGYGDSS
jgi:hypothetical protein